LLAVWRQRSFLQAVAFGKLQGILDSKPLNLPGKNFLNLAMLGAVLTCGGLFLTTGDPQFGVAMLWATAAIGGVLGAHLTASIGELSVDKHVGVESSSAVGHCCHWWRAGCPSNCISKCL
jgi:NAD/NADP transhydrogenase beta subunit